MSQNEITYWLKSIYDFIMDKIAEFFQHMCFSYGSMCAFSAFLCVLSSLYPIWSKPNWQHLKTLPDAFHWIQWLQGCSVETDLSAFVLTIHLPISNGQTQINHHLQQTDFWILHGCTCHAHSECEVCFGHVPRTFHICATTILNNNCWALIFFVDAFTLFIVTLV